MRLDKLKVINKVDNKLIREIKFNPKGLSLFVDDTNNESGSNIGKTTAAKIIDLCLGAKHTSSLYKENDTGENTIVKDFINDKKVYADLYVTIGNEPYIFSRDLFKNGKCYINNEKLNSYKDFVNKLNIIIFKNNNEKPTFRELMSKFIRLNLENESSLLKYLPGGHRTNLEYQIVYDFLLGLKRNKGENFNLSKKISSIESEISAFLSKNNVSSIDELESKLNLLSINISDLKEEYRNLSIVDDYEKKEENLDKLLIKINNFQEEFNKIKLKSILLSEKIEKESKNIFNVDYKILKTLYDETNAILNKPLKEFRELELFHNGMVQKRIQVLENSLKDNNILLDKLEKELKIMRKDYENSYTTFNSELNEKFEEKFTDYTLKKDTLASIKNDYDYLLKKIQDKKELESKLNNETISEELQKSVKKSFNNYFSTLTKDIVGESFELCFNTGSDEFPISITGLSGKPGTGVKKSLITCFDLAFIDFIIEKNYHMPKFEIHDKLENISIPELKAIVKATHNFEGQYIFPILRDRIKETDIKEEDIVLKLSKDKKFFLI